MNPIFQFIQMLIVLLVGARTVQPVHDLRKKPTREDHLKKLNCTLKKYSYIFLGLFFLGLFIVVVIVAIISIGPSAVDSGLVYNHMDKII